MDALFRPIVLVGNTDEQDLEMVISLVIAKVMGRRVREFLAKGGSFASMEVLGTKLHPAIIVRTQEDIWRALSTAYKHLGADVDLQGGISLMVINIANMEAGLQSTNPFVLDKAFEVREPGTNINPEEEVAGQFILVLKRTQELPPDPGEDGVYVRNAPGDQGLAAFEQIFVA